VSEFAISAWIGLGYAGVLVIVSTVKNRRIMYEQIGFVVGAVVGCQNIFPPVRLISFAMTENHQPLPDPLAGYDKYLLVAGAAAGMATLVSLYSLFMLASKVIPKA
jgi:hypothetical protein